MTEMSGHRTSFGKYTLHERIGRGGFADIFKATLAGAPAGSGTLAIKRMFPHLAEDTLFASMFIQEAKLSSLLAHPCIVRIEEFGAVDGVLYIAMEHVEGRDLSQALHRLGRLGLGMPPALAAFIVSRVAGALHYAHRRRDLGARPLNIIHRDVTPQNVLLSWQGEVKLADFGIAKATTSQIRTRTGALKGKYPYMAPEQLEDHCDHRSDLYSAGVILWELIAGRRLFTGETDWQVLQQVAGGEIPPITDLAPVSAGLAAIISRALATDPGARFQSGEEMAQALLRAAACPKQLTGAEALAGFLEGLYVEDTVVTEAGFSEKVEGQVSRIGSRPKALRTGRGRFRGMELIGDQDSRRIVLVFCDTLGPELFDFPLFCWEGAHLSATNLELQQKLQDGSLIFDVTSRTEFMLDMDRFSVEEQTQSLWEKVAAAAEIEVMLLAAGGAVSHEPDRDPGGER